MWNELLGIDEDKYEELKEMIIYKGRYEKCQEKYDKSDPNYDQLKHWQKIRNKDNIMKFMNDYNEWKKETNKKLDEIERNTGLIGENIIKYLRPGLIYGHKLDGFLKSICDYIRLSGSKNLSDEDFPDIICSYSHPLNQFSWLNLCIAVDKYNVVFVSPTHLMTLDNIRLYKWRKSQKAKNTIRDKYWDIIKDNITKYFDIIYFNYIKAYRFKKKQDLWS